MSIRVRFAPSPTGYLHIGGARTALYNYLFAKQAGGTFVVRVEDTDLARSKREYELAQMDDLKWLGITYDEGPDKPGEYGPYRQSERLDIYKKYAAELVEKGIAYPCFLTADELEELTNKALGEKKAPHAYHGQYRDLDPAEASKRIEAGDEYVIRFKNPQRPYSFKDLVRGEVKFQEDMVGDFVIMRSNGLPVYNFCCVIDDYLMKISHVIRAEDHLNNTLRQMMIYEAIEAPLPTFAHLSLLVGEDRQKLSKRHGATSVTQYKEEDYLPQALSNYLCLLGWSHPEEQDIFDVHELGDLFTLDRFTKAPALYDIVKLKHFNEQHIRKLTVSELKAAFDSVIDSGNAYHDQTDEWKERFSAFFQDKVQLFNEITEGLGLVFGTEKEESEQLSEALAWETTGSIREYITGELAAVSEDFVSEELLSKWMDHCKKELKIKGKPLFMGTRAVLTGRAHGPDLKTLVSLTPKSILVERVNS
jgi:glutamyl-tRNA synthetase